MKHIIVFLLAAALLCIGGCKKDDPASAAANVSFAISSQPGASGGVMFIAKPSIDVKLTAVVGQLPAQNFRENIPIQNSNQVFSSANWYELREFTGVTSGQQWTFSFTGTVANGGAAYNVNSSYTVP